MISSFRALALVSTFVLASCGGGGGGGSTSTGTASSGPQSVTITETNAKAVAGSALDAVVSGSAASDTSGLPLAVQVDTAAAAGTTRLQRIANLARSAANSYVATALPTGVSVSQTVGCAVSGTMTISGEVAGSSGLVAGDWLTVTMNSCVEAVGMSMNGALTLRVISGSLTATMPFHVVLQLTATNLTEVIDGVTEVTNGVVTLDWTATSATSQSLVATSSAISLRTSASGAKRTLRDFSQTMTINGSTSGAYLTGTVETDSTSLGGTTVIYTISTPTPVVWDEVTGKITAGVIKVVGANNAQLLITINSGGSVTVQLDANGDGAFEKTITTTTTELAGLV